MAVFVPGMPDGYRASGSRKLIQLCTGSMMTERIGRCPSAVSRESARHGGQAGYRAVVARRVAAEHRRRPEPRCLDVCPQLRREMVTRLRWAFPGHGRFKIECEAWCGRLRPPPPAPGLPNSTAESSEASGTALRLSLGTQERPLTPPGQLLTADPGLAIRS